MHVTSTPSEVGSPTLLTCAVPNAVRDHASVAAWYRDDAVISAGDHFCKYFIINCSANTLNKTQPLWIQFPRNQFKIPLGLKLTSLSTPKSNLSKRFSWLRYKINTLRIINCLNTRFSLACYVQNNIS